MAEGDIHQIEGQTNVVGESTMVPALGAGKSIQLLWCSLHSSIGVALGRCWVLAGSGGRRICGIDASIVSTQTEVFTWPIYGGKFGWELPENEPLVMELVMGPTIEYAFLYREGS